MFTGIIWTPCQLHASRTAQTALLGFYEVSMACIVSTQLQLVNMMLCKTVLPAVASHPFPVIPLGSHPRGPFCRPYAIFHPSYIPKYCWERSVKARTFPLSYISFGADRVVQWSPVTAISTPFLTERLATSFCVLPRRSAQPLSNVLLRLPPCWLLPSVLLPDSAGCPVS
jgi:hypothetical protein